MSENNEKLSSRLAQEHIDNVERLTRIESVVMHLDECIDELKKKLFGNGQPGVIQMLDARISAQEKWIWRTTGILAAGFGIVNIVLIVLSYVKK